MGLTVGGSPRYLCQIRVYGWCQQAGHPINSGQETLGTIWAQDTFRAAKFCTILFQRYKILYYFVGGMIIIELRTYEGLVFLLLSCVFNDPQQFLLKLISFALFESSCKTFLSVYTLGCLQSMMLHI